MAEQLAFNDSLNLLGSLGTGVTTLGGTANVTYGAPNTVTGSLNLSAAGALTAQTYTNLAVTQTGTAPDGVTPIYTLTGSNLLTSVSITYTGQAPTTMTANVTLLATGLSVASGSGNVTSTVVCFAAGTTIRTTRGDVAVEHLEVGDLAITASGAQKPIRWLSHGTIDCLNHPRPHEVLPVLISAHAFDKDRPARDLFVSPGHSICVDILGEVLIPAIALVNGSTIQQVEVDKVSYWHVELDSHDILLAENMPAESYLDMGNRGFFLTSKVVELGASPDADPSQRTHADFCRPYVDGGPILGAVKMQLRRRAENIGWVRNDALELHLVVDGRRLDPVVRGLTARFEVPADAKNVWLNSPTARPCDMLGSIDSRDLGLLISAISINDGFAVRDVAIDDPMLCIGFHAVEEGCRRWTTGRARLPSALWEGCEDVFFLRIELAGMPVARWVLPATEAVTVERPRLVVVA